MWTEFNCCHSLQFTKLRNNYTRSNFGVKQIQEIQILVMKREAEKLWYTYLIQIL
jgi:hypothetical protein